ncbi:hypothetical protein [Pseudomonas sp. SO81]|uniref:hypothetical protein n=1 Tax=Pseudomonas sp. SO81 TaxID=2983246 RepID=UPI0025A3EE68|nr:hypothetical protein [Pseudomonas sp. SO81]WJN58414.1 hypothetical protein OH686_06680 [Pseudomonas sp. SO81]
MSKACAERLKASNGEACSDLWWGLPGVIADSATPAQHWLLGLQQIPLDKGLKWLGVVVNSLKFNVFFLWHKSC